MRKENKVNDLFNDIAVGISVLVFLSFSVSCVVILILKL